MSPPRRCHLAWALGALLAVHGGGVPASAKPRSEAARKAARLAKAGKAAFKKGRYDDALTAFRVAYRKAPRPKYLYNQGLVHSKLGRHEEAISALERYLHEAPHAKDREKVETTLDFMKQKLEETQVPLVVLTRPAGAALSIEGARSVTGTTPWSAWLPPGRYTLTVSRKGQDDVSLDLVLVIGEPQKIEIGEETPAEQEETPAEQEETPAEREETPAEAHEDADPSPPLPPEPAAPPPPGAPAEPPASAGLGAGTWIALGVGVAALVASAVLAGAAESKGDEYDDYVAGRGSDGRTRSGARALKDETSALGVAAAVALAAGGVGVGLGGVLLVMRW